MRMSLRRSLAAAAVCSFVIAGAQVKAVAHGGGGVHPSFGQAIGHGFYSGRPQNSYWGGFHRDLHHFPLHDRLAHHFAPHDFDHWDGHGTGDHFGHWQPGRWHAAPGFGARGRRDEDGVWHL